MADSSDPTRRQLLAGAGGLGIGAVALGGVGYWRQADAPSAETDDDDLGMYEGLSGKDIDDLPDGKTGSDAITLEMPKKDGERFNSNSVSFDHHGFVVCNHGKAETAVWLDSDSIENDRGEPAVQFYPDGDLGTRLDDPANAVTLEADDCVQVGVMTRTFGIAAETTLLEQVVVRTDRTP